MQLNALSLAKSTDHSLKILTNYIEKYMHNYLEDFFFTANMTAECIKMFCL